MLNQQKQTDMARSSGDKQETLISGNENKFDENMSKPGTQGNDRPSLEQMRKEEHIDKAQTRPESTQFKSKQSLFSIIAFFSHFFIDQ